MSEQVRTSPVIDPVMPNAPKAQDGSDIKPILSQERREQAFDGFVGRIRQGFADYEQLGRTDISAADYTKAEVSLQNNPYKRQIDELRAQYINERDTHGQQFADERMKAAVQERADNFMYGLDVGAPNDSMNQGIQAAFAQLIQGNFMGAIKTFLLSMPIVGDTMAAAGKWVKAKFSGRDLSFSEAREEIRQENAMAGAATALGADEQSVGAIVATGYQDFARPAPAAANIELDATLKNQNFAGLSEEAIAQVNALQNEGKLVLNGDKPFATQEALDVLDNIPSQSLPGREGASWKKDETTVASR